MLYFLCGSQDDDRLVGLYADNMKLCTCYMCSNLRRTSGPTMQELKAPTVEDFEATL